MNPKLLKRHFYNGVDYILDEQNQVVKLTDQFHDRLLNKKLWFGKGFKKISGSAAGDVLLNGPFDSKFAAFCRMAWISLPMLDDKYVNAGNEVEPKVIDKLLAQMRKKNQEAEILTYPGEKYEYDYFKDKDDIIGGLPDGFAKPWNIIIEIKTTGEKNYSKWQKNDIPKGYIKQSQMYSYLMGVNKFVIAASFLKEEDYLYPENVNIEERKFMQIGMSVNRDEVEKDIKTIKEFWTKHAQSGVSPQFDSRKDKDLIEYLRCRNQQEWVALLEKWKADGKVNSVLERRKLHGSI